MSGQRQGRGTLALLGVLAVAVVIALAAALGFDPRDVLAPPETARTTPPAPGGPPAPGAPPGLATAPPGEPKPQTAEAGKPEPAPAPPPAASAEAPAPSFDVVRVEPNGESVIAGRSAPGATIEMVRDGQVHARTAADQSGLFAFVPPPLPPGSHQVTLQSIAPDGTRQRSKDSVTIVLNEGAATRPLVALTSPEKPTVLLSNPEAPEPRTAEAKPGDPKAPDAKAGDARTAEARAAAATAGGQRSPDGRAAQPQPAPQGGAQQHAAVPPNGAGRQPESPEAQRPGPVPPAPPAPGQPAAPRPEVRITTVEAEEGGRLYVSGQAAPGSTVRLYLNETLIAPGGVGADGKVAFAIGRGVRPGDYRVRIDDVDPVSGAVKSRAEVVFNVPVPVAAAPQQAPVPQGPSAPQVAQAPAAPSSSDRPQAGSPQAQRPSPPAAGAGPETAARPSAPTPSAIIAQQAPLSSPTAPPGLSAGAQSRSDGPSAGPQAGSQVASATPEMRDLPPGTVVVPDINTAIVSRGDNLWRISQRIYGKGVRYTVIYGANQGQIRNPNRIYPGQVFVLPDDEERPKEP